MKNNRLNRFVTSILFFIFFFTLSGCQDSADKQLPVIAKATREFSLHNQDNQVVNRALFRDRIVVTDFFFTTCPSICPIMKRQMHRVYERFKDTPDVLLFSHSIDPEHDTVEVLRNYADGLGIKTSSWQMVTGNQDEIFALAKHYMLGALKNEEVPGGYIHSGSFVLIDRNGQIRGYYNGTEEQEVNQLMIDMEILING